MARSPSRSRRGGVYQEYSNGMIITKKKNRDRGRGVVVAVVILVVKR